MEKAYKYRIYPNKKQKEQLAKIFGSCRFIYNHYLAKRIELYEKDKTSYNYYDCANDVSYPSPKGNGLVRLMVD